jgi:hypothetical protein
MRRYLVFVTAGGIAVAAAALSAGTSRAQVSPLPMPSQQPVVTPGHPIVGGHHVQPSAGQVQTQGLQTPMRQQTQEMDRLARQLLDASKTKSGMDD